MRSCPWCRLSSGPSTIAADWGRSHAVIAGACPKKDDSARTLQSSRRCCCHHLLDPSSARARGGTFALDCRLVRPRRVVVVESPLYFAVFVLLQCGIKCDITIIERCCCGNWFYWLSFTSACLPPPPPSSFPAAAAAAADLLTRGHAAQSTTTTAVWLESQSIRRRWPYIYAGQVSWVVWVVAERELLSNNNFMYHCGNIE